MIISSVRIHRQIKLVTILAMSTKKKVILAVSGGIDSSTSAYWLLKAGYEVIGVYLDLWKGFSDEEKIKSSTQATEKKLAKLSKDLAFPIRIIDKKEEFHQTIVSYFINSLKNGLTPNPCVVCNKHIKFKVLFDCLKDFDADFIATGHYARTRRKHNGKMELLKGLDRTKDQSYYLVLLNQEILKKIIFPLGESIKEDVKKVYKKNINPEADLSESQDLCFLSGFDYRTFLSKYAPECMKSGEIVNSEGKQLGIHSGLAFYTIGQRKGLQISAKEPYFVIKKSTQDNRLVVGFEEELGRRTFLLHNVNWISGEPQSDEKQYAVKIRYRSKPVRATSRMISGQDTLEIKTKKVLRDITPGQFAVLYHRDSAIAGGEISYN
ncbi:MAG: tRNA 2-thiouridine(34) synthase MnmA [Anaerolineaceae bacterium]|jgi:tRNA-specific 2-thiouridylase|nr:MAG: tRNA 2-thiouridine(34) synthase MnmA [Anaerolineaceae bacterium]